MGRKKDPKTAKIEDLERSLKYANEDKERYKNNVYELEEKLEKQENRVTDLIREIRRDANRFIEEVYWMRQLVELLCVPKEKLEELQKIREEQVQNLNPDDFVHGRRNY